MSIAAADREESSYTPDDAALTRFAQVSRWLLPLTFEQTETLRAYYGLSGYRWASTKWGRLFALIPFTRTGRRVLGREANPQAISQHELLENRVAAIDKLSDINAKVAANAKLVESTNEAQEKFACAVIAWNASVAADRDKRKGRR